MTDRPLAIEATGLRKIFRGGGWFGGRKGDVHAVKGVDLRVADGETLAIVGESGSGKSTVARMLVGLETPTQGRISIAGQPAEDLARQGRQTFGRTIQYVFQDPVASLNPRYRVGSIIGGTMKRLGHGAARDRRARMEELLAHVGMTPDALERYPHEFSGGQAQRLAIARALAAEARILVLDEPVSALDVSVQAQVLLLLDRLKTQFGLTYIFISHDLAVVEAMADRIAVMNGGEIVEEGDAGTVFNAPKAEYTRTLLASAPAIFPADVKSTERRELR